MIVHEIVHLLIEDRMQKYKVLHWEKERIVDSILNSPEFSFLHFNSWKNDYQNLAGDKRTDVYYVATLRNVRYLNHWRIELGEELFKYAKS